MKLNPRIYAVYKVCGTVGHFSPIYKTYIINILKFPRLILKSFPDETMRDFVPQSHNIL